MPTPLLFTSKEESFGLKRQLTQSLNITTAAAAAEATVLVTENMRLAGMGWRLR